MSVIHSLLSGNSNTLIMPQRPVKKTSRQEGHTRSKIQCSEVKDEGMIGRLEAGVGGSGRGRTTGRDEEVIAVALLYFSLLYSQTVENRKSGDTWTTFLQCPMARARGQCMTVRMTETGPQC